MGFDIPEEVVRVASQTAAPPPPGEPVEIVLTENWGHIEGTLAQGVKDILAMRLSFQPPGYEFSDKYRSGEWDGWVHLFNKRKQRFPVGLLRLVTDLLTETGVEYSIRDERTVSGITLSLQWRGPSLRQYQQRALQQALAAGMGFIVMPTGSGKTLLALRLIYELGVPTVVFVHRKELLYQWADRVQRVLGVCPGLVGDGYHDEQAITIAMLQTAHTAPLQRRYDMVICDEGHHIPAKTFQSVAASIPARYRFAMSATMRREDGLEMLLWTQTGTPVVEVRVEELVEEDFLARPIFVNLEYTDVSYRRVYDYSEEVRWLVSSSARNRVIVRFVAEMFRRGHRCYVDVRRIRHGKLLARLLNEMGVPAIFISGRDASTRRGDVLERFEHEHFVLVSTLIKEGVDLPSMTVVVLAGAGKSGTQVIQTIGRALRPKEGTNEAFIVDVADTRGPFAPEHHRARQKMMEDYYGSLYRPVSVSLSNLDSWLSELDSDCSTQKQPPDCDIQHDSEELLTS